MRLGKYVYHSSSIVLKDCRDINCYLARKRSLWKPTLQVVLSTIDSDYEYVPTMFRFDTFQEFFVAFLSPLHLLFGTGIHGTDGMTR